MLSEAVIMTLITVSGGVLALIAKLSYSSKCRYMKCFGCCVVERDTQHENNIIASSTRTIELTSKPTV
jgi:hypothetical protein